jgi:hypothetical protein
MSLLSAGQMLGKMLTCMPSTSWGHDKKHQLETTPLHHIIPAYSWSPPLLQNNHTLHHTLSHQRECVCFHREQLIWCKEWSNEPLMNSILEMSQDKVITMNIINTHHPIGSLKIFIIFHVGQKGHQFCCTTPQYYGWKLPVCTLHTVQEGLEVCESRLCGSQYRRHTGVYITLDADI